MIIGALSLRNHDSKPSNTDRLDLDFGLFYQVSAKNTPLPSRAHTWLMSVIGTSARSGGRVERCGVVKNYMSRLLTKLGMERRAQAGVLATQLRDQGYHRDTE